MATSFRTRLFGIEQAIIPEIPANGWSRQQAARPALPPHRHQREFELCLVTRGTVEWWAQERMYTVSPGYIYITYPGEVHGAVGSVMHPCELYWLRLRLPTREALPGLTVQATRAIRKDLRSLSTRTFPVSQFTEEQFFRIHAQHCDPGTHCVAVVRGALLSLLTGVLRDHQTWSKDQQGLTVSVPIANVMQQITCDPVTALCMEELASDAGLGVSQFQTRFRNEVGLPIGQYRARVRNHLAKRLLHDTDQSITEIAMQLGFASSQHFASHFRQMNGLSPRKFRHLGRDDFWGD